MCLQAETAGCKVFVDLETQLGMYGRLAILFTRKSHVGCVHCVAIGLGLLLGSLGLIQRNISEIMITFK